MAKLYRHTIMFFRNNTIQIFGMVAVLLLVTCVDSFADGDLGAMADTVKDQADNIAIMAKYIGMMIGLILLVTSIISFATMKKTQTPISTPITMLAAGIVLLSLTTFIGTGSTSLFGSDASQTAITDLGLGN